MNDSVDEQGASVIDERAHFATLLTVLSKITAGDLDARMPVTWTGVEGKVADKLNELLLANQSFDDALARISDAVAGKGRLSQRLAPGGRYEGWLRGAESVNSLIDALVLPTTEMQRVIGAVASGDLSQKVSGDVHGDLLDLKNTINAMVDQFSGFISEVTRVAREVGTEGKLGQAAAVTIEVGGVWKDLTDNVNLMAGNLTGQVRNIAEVTTAVANGDLSKKITIDVKGEFLALKNTVNAMVDQLNAFAGEVTRVAREVGVEGKLGGQATSTEIGGVWKDLTDNVNQLAANLTNQVRAISDVATAVTEGDLTRQVRVEASGEVAILKDTLNEMIRNLRETTRQNIEQDWLKTSRERFTRMLQGQRDLDTVSEMILSELAPLVGAQHGAFYLMGSAKHGEPVLRLQAGYGYQKRKHLSTSFRVGEGLVGQCAKERSRILLTDVPGDYVQISSGLGSASPLNIIVVPVLFEGSVLAVLELASFSAFTPAHLAFLDQLPESIGLVLNTIEADTLTGNLLKQSQSLTDELRAQKEELGKSNEDLGRQAAQLARQNTQVAQTNREIEKSARLLEEKAAQLAATSRYKSEFIANMSHELRTPLNSLLILAEQLEANPDRNMTDVQVEYATVIRSSGNDLLMLLNDILDLAKVESGTVVMNPIPTLIESIRTNLLREFEPVATAHSLSFRIDVTSGCPDQIVADPDRLRQVMKNLLTNSFKFTPQGEVRVEIGIAAAGWNPSVQPLVDAPSVLSMAVIDTGIGIEPEHQARIFDEFAQGDGRTTRLYGGTGLGLSISREYVRLMGGEITVSSQPDLGSTFTVFLPMVEPVLDRAPSPDRRTVAVGGRPRPTTNRGQPPALDALPYHRIGTDDGGALRGLQVFVVDDDMRNVFALTALLERCDAIVSYAENGWTAVEQLAEDDNIQIVLMDIMMPIMDGYETIRAIRQGERGRRVPIIAVTGKVVDGERKRCTDAGADDYIPKPVSTHDLLAAIVPWIALPVGKSPWLSPRPRALNPTE